MSSKTQAASKGSYKTLDGPQTPGPSSQYSTSSGGLSGQKPLQASSSTKAIVTKKLGSTGPINLQKPQRYGLTVHLQSSVKDLYLM